MSSDDPQLVVSELIQRGLPFHRVTSEVKRLLERVADRLVDLDGLLLGGPADHRPHRQLEREVLRRLAALWEQGWMPADVAHVVRRDGGTRVANLAICAIDAAVRSLPCFDAAPDGWAAQLEALRAALPATSAMRMARAVGAEPRRPFEEWLSGGGGSVAELIEDGLVLHVTLRSLRPLARTAIPPSRWTTASASGSASGVDAPASGSASGSASAKTLATIRGLLAKSESTAFPAEAEAFAAKAQELMTKHSIDAAMLDRRHGSDLAAGVRVRRFPLDQPYAKEKVALLAAVGSLNNLRVVFDELYGMADAVGFEDDLELVDLLFTSLLVQASRALGATTSAARSGGSSRAAGSRASSAAFRRAFWLAYAARIGERLTDARARARAESVETYGSALVPLLQERTDAIDARVGELFGRLRAVTTRSVDAQGWHAGRSAADSATLGVASGRLRR